MNEYKFCGMCHKYKPIDNFHKNQSRCKACRKLQNDFQSDEQRFWSRVTKLSNAPYCWLWGKQTSNQQPMMWFHGKREDPQHVAFRLCKRGEVPERGCVIATCGNSRCVNPNHLQALTREEYRIWHANHISDLQIGKPSLGSGGKGEHNPNARLTADQVREIRRKRDQGEPILSIAAEYGCSRSCIGLITTRRNWKHI